MTPTERVIAEVTRVYGLVPRQDWPELVSKGLAELSHAERTPAEALVEDPARLQATAGKLVGALTIGETYFLRHPTHFDAIVSRAREVLADPGRTFTVWCAGCSSGEEPYSVAIALVEAVGAPALARVRIVATDISPIAIARARRATYGRWSFRDAPSWLQDRYFAPDGEHAWQLVGPIRDAITFETSCTLARAVSLARSSVDVVMFRNVGIYFSAEALSTMFDETWRVLASDGLLLVAPGDPRPGARFAATADESTSVYRRAEEAPPPVWTPATRPPTARPPPPRAPRAVAQRTPRPTPPPAAPATAQPEALSTARALADRGDLDGALRLLAGASDPDSALLEGQILVAAGRNAQAIDALRRVTFRAPAHRIGRYWYAVALANCGMSGPALAQARAALEGLALPDDAPLEDGVTRAAELRDAVREIVERLT